LDLALQVVDLFLGLGDNLFVMRLKTGEGIKQLLVLLPKGTFERGYSVRLYN